MQKMNTPVFNSPLLFFLGGNPRDNSIKDRKVTFN